MKKIVSYLFIYHFLFYLSAFAEDFLPDQIIKLDGKITVSQESDQFFP